MVGHSDSVISDKYQKFSEMLYNVVNIIVRKLAQLSAMV